MPRAAALALAFLALSVPLAAAAPLNKFVAYGSVASTHCPSLDLRAVGNGRNATEWEITAAINPKSTILGCVLFLADAASFRTTWDPAIGGCMLSTGGLVTFCMESPARGIAGAWTDYEVSWCRATACVAGTIRIPLAQL